MKVIKSDIQWKDTLKNNIYLKDSVKHQEVLNKLKFYQKNGNLSKECHEKDIWN